MGGLPSRTDCDEVVCLSLIVVCSAGTYAVRGERVDNERCRGVAIRPLTLTRGEAVGYDEVDVILPVVGRVQRRQRPQSLV